MSHAKIGRIRLKARGADLHLIRQQTPNQGDENWAGELAGFSRRMLDHTETNGPLTGFVAVAFYADGSTCANYRWGDKAPFNRALLPLYVAEIIRRDVITESEAIHVFNEMFDRA